MSQTNKIFFSGWMPSPPDHRDHIYSAPVQTDLPAKVYLCRPPLSAPFEPTWNQGSLGSCGPQSAAKDIVYGLLRQRQQSAVMPSRLFIYYCTRLLMGTINQDSGVTNRALLKSLAQYGWCDESLWPYDIGQFKVKPPSECFRQAEGRKIDEYLSVRQDLDQMKGCLAGGDPFILGFSVYESLQSDAVARTGDVPMPSRSERLRGGHDVLVVGYDDELKRFIFVNSWGPQWGDDGYGTIPYDYAVNPQLAGDFWTVRFEKEPSPVPPLPTRTITISGASKIYIDGKEI